jgi:SAM-dependent methyltransferase
VTVRVSPRIAIAVALLVGALAVVIHFRHRPARFVPFVPTEPDVAAVMIDLAQIRPGDVAYDLGCGDGRLVIRAILAGAERGVCVDLDPVRMFDAQLLAQRAGVLDRIKFVVGDARKTDLAGASVVFLYLSHELNVELAPALRALPAGTRIVSHWHDMGARLAKPDRTVRVTGSRFGDRNVYLWIIP